MDVLLKKCTTRYLIAFALITFMTACTTTSTTVAPEDVAPALFSELDASSDFYLNKDMQLNSDGNLQWKFLALQALIKEKKFIPADAMIKLLQAKALTTEQSAALKLLIANKLYAQKKLPETQTALTSIDNTMLNQIALINYLKLQTTMHMHNELPLKASESMLLLAPLLTNDLEKQAYNDLLLAQLTLLPRKTLTQYQAVTLTRKSLLSVDPQFKAGWYALAALYQKNKLRPNRLEQALEQWKSMHVGHIALPFMPLVLVDIAQFSPYQPKNIAVLLPLSGQFQKPGKAIQMGLLNAYYHQQKDGDTLNTPKLHFFDTQTSTPKEIAALLKEENIDFVVGPLMKKKIAQLLPLIEEFPVLALNSFAKKTANSRNSAVAWHYAFPLSPENEAKQAAIRIKADRYKKPLIIVPNSNYGRRVAAAFKSQWATLTPTSNVRVEAHYFRSKAQFPKFIARVLHADKSKSRINQMNAITKKALKSKPYSRRDVDVIYIVSKRDELTLLKPFIDVTVSPFAKQMPLYASSRSHSFDHHKMQNRELSGIVFSDNPFLLDQDSALRVEARKVLKRKSFSTLRLFALGFDSYQLIEQLVYLQSNDEALYKGLIGELHLGTDNSIQAKLSWAKYIDGELVEVTSSTTTK